MCNQLRDQLRYQPFYCEENIWWLCAEPPSGVSIEQVIFIASRNGACPIAEQRAGGADGVAWWDYHCVGLDHERRIWDLDSLLPLPVAASTWIDRSFPGAVELPASLRPRFRVVPSALYLEHFRSDRRHMRSAHGAWLQPPPPWACIGASGRLGKGSGHGSPDEPGSEASRGSSADASSHLDHYRDLTNHEGPGVVLELGALQARYS